MKAFLRFGFAVFAAALVFNLFAVTETKAQGTINEIYKRMEAHRNSLQTLRANVIMDKFNSQLGIHDTMKGKAAYVPLEGKSVMFRIDWDDPQEILSVTKNQYVIYRPRLKQAIVGNPEKAKGSGKANNLFAFLNMSKADLKKNYTVKYIGQENIKDGTRTWHLELTPKIRSQYKKAEMWVDVNGMPLQIKITEKNNDATTVFLSNLQKNITLNASFFNVNYPKKTTKIIPG